MCMFLLPPTHPPPPLTPQYYFSYNNKRCTLPTLTLPYPPLPTPTHPYPPLPFVQVPHTCNLRWRYPGTLKIDVVLFTRVPLSVETSRCI